MEPAQELHAIQMAARNDYDPNIMGGPLNVIYQRLPLQQMRRQTKTQYILELEARIQLLERCVTNGDITTSAQRNEIELLRERVTILLNSLRYFMDVNNAYWK